MNILFIIIGFRFVYVPAPHTAEVLSDILVNCLFDWNLNRKLSTLIIDNCSTNDAMIERVFVGISPSSKEKIPYCITSDDIEHVEAKV